MNLEIELWVQSGSVQFVSRFLSESDCPMVRKASEIAVILTIVFVKLLCYLLGSPALFIFMGGCFKFVEMASLCDGPATLGMSILSFRRCWMISSNLLGDSSLIGWQMGTRH
ncbi:hypothetical protein RRG08_013690 [Elysia crispata]|uniref:Uncharacterized protein n=1 Tax=Elysia crispata TaxID=231223 RepID=A0AAE0ZME2_9GAST|nr:hypothetical protein RRG08_013690 [Elysia crispata]